VPLLTIALPSGAGSLKYAKSDFNADQVVNREMFATLKVGEFAFFN
jgi:hypothetical protein